jgi:hypothetical protein
MTNFIAFISSPEEANAIEKDNTYSFEGLFLKLANDEQATVHTSCM